MKPVQCSHKENITIELIDEDFTCICPRLGVADYATVKVTYMPRNGKIIATEDFEEYMMSFRNKKMLHEDIVVQIRDDLIKLLEPKLINVVAQFKGNILCNVEI